MSCNHLRSVATLVTDEGHARHPPQPQVTSQWLFCHLGEVPDVISACGQLVVPSTSCMLLYHSTQAPSNFASMAQWKWVWSSQISRSATDMHRFHSQVCIPILSARGGSIIPRKKKQKITHQLKDNHTPTHQTKWALKNVPTPKEALKKCPPPTHPTPLWYPYTIVLYSG
jgi:hypothetical protein